MYTNKSFKRLHDFKVRLNDYEAERLQKFMDIHGGEKAVVVREIVFKEVDAFLYQQEQLTAEKSAQLVMH